MTATLVELRAQVHATPADRALRSIYADALQAIGDPRGDFIALQLANAEPAQASALLDAHWRDWLGPIATCTTRAGIEFRDGFLAQLAIATPPAMARLDWHRIHRAAEWCTVETLRIHTDALATASCEHLAGLLRYAPLKSLRDLEAPASVLRLVRGQRFPLRTVTVTAADERLELDADIVRGAHLVCRRRRWHDAESADMELWRFAITAEVATLVIESPYLHGVMLSQVAAAIARDGTRPAHLHYRFPDARIELGLDRLAIQLVPSPHSPEAQAAIEALRRFAPLLPRFGVVALSTLALDGNETRVFEGTGASALPWLEAHPPSPSDDDDDDD